MDIFLTGASGYIGGSVAAGLVRANHSVRGLVRSETAAEAVRARGITPVMGTLDDAETLDAEARAADAVINAANSDHRGAVEALLGALEGTGKAFLHTSGSSIVGTRAAGARVDDIFDETTPVDPSPDRAARVALNKDILGHADRGVRVVILCPALIYGAGLGAGAHSMQVPWLLDLAHDAGVPKHVGPGENIWSHVHIEDLVDLFLLALEKAPTGAFYYAENGEASMREVCVAIGQMLGQSGETVAMDAEEAASIWGDGPANATMGSNSRVRAIRAREELGWAPKGPPLMTEILTGCYSSPGPS